MTSHGWVRIGGVATVCALAGAGAGIAGSTAATSTKTGTAAKPAGKAAAARTAPPGRPGPGRGFGGPGFGFRGGPPVHEESVVLDKTGKKFITVTSDNGTVKSISGNDVVITEGTKDVTYKDVTVTLPADAAIVRNGKDAKVADLKAGDHVHVSSSSDGTFVFAADDSFKPQGPGRGRGPGGPGFGGHHGPPPGMGPGGNGAPAPTPGTP